MALVRQGNAGAFEALVQRYQARLLAFCRHMLGSKEDAEDVLQEVFAAAYNALLADERRINVRPWLYRIARNRSLNHLRKPKTAGMDSMDIFERDNGTTTAETVHRREEFRQIVSDVQELPETQKTALLLREIDALSYEHIAEAMDTTVPSVKSLLVRARVSLAEAAEARLLTCEEVRLELGQVAEGLTRSSAPVRRHLRSCERCRVFRSELRNTSRALAAVFPLGPLVVLKLGLAKLGFGGAAAGGSATAGGAGIAGGAGLAATGAASTAAGSAISAGVGTVASKAAAGMAAAVIVTAGAVEVEQVARREAAPAPVVAAAPQQAPVTPIAPPAAPARPRPQAAPADRAKKATAARPAAPAAEPAPAPVEPAPAPTPAAEVPPAPPPAPAPVQEEESTTTLPPRESPPETAPAEPVEEPSSGPAPGSQPAPPAGEPTPTPQPPPPPPPS